MAKISTSTAKSLEEVRPSLKYMNLKNRREIVNSKCNYIATYGLELLFGQTKWTQKEPTAIIMRNHRAVFMKDFFKISNRRICAEICVDKPLAACKKPPLDSYII